MSEIVTQTDEEAYADFAKRYAAARGDYQLARVLSGRLRELDKRAKAANKRADEAEANRRASIIAERNRCISIAQSIEPHNEAEAHLIETIVRKMRGDE